MKRNRIVINVDQAQGRDGSSGGKARGGFLRPLLIIGVVLLLLLGGVMAGGFLWWRQYQGSPAYSLALLADASQRNDNATVDSLLDMDKVTEDFVSQVRKHTAGAYSSLPSDWSAKLDSVVTALTPKLKETVHDELMKELQRLTAPAAGKPFVVVALAIKYFASIKEENNVATAVVNVKDERLQLTMQPEAGHWRITAVQDDKLAKMISDRVKGDLPAATAPVQDEIRKQLDKLKENVRGK
jgi:uncharacterized membrane protein